MASELAPRFQLSAIIRTIFVFFGVFALLNGHAYIGPFRDAAPVRAAFAASWAAVSVSKFSPSSSPSSVRLGGF